MALERLGQVFNYALFADRKPANITTGNRDPQILSPVITLETIRSCAVMMGGLYKLSTTPLLASAGYDFFKAGEALSQQDYTQALFWAAKSLGEAIVGSAIVGTIHWGQSKLAPKQDFIHLKTNLRPYYFTNFYYAKYISGDKQFPLEDPFRRFLPFVKNSAKRKLAAELKDMKDLEVTNLHPVSKS